VVFDAPRWLDALHALGLAKDLGVPPMLAGVRDAYRIVPQLQAAGAAVVLGLDFPQPPKDQDPDADADPLEALRDRQRTPESAALLHRAGVRFALTAHGLEEPADFRSGSRPPSSEVCPARPRSRR